MSTENTLDTLYEVKEHLEDALDKLREAERDLRDTRLGGQLRQVRAQLEMLCSHEHEWLGGSSYVLSDVIDRLEEEEEWVEA